MIIGLDVGGTHADVVLLDNQGLPKQFCPALPPASWALRPSARKQKTPW